MRAVEGKGPRSAQRMQNGGVAQAATAAASMARQLPTAADISIAVRTAGHILSVTPEDRKGMPKEEIFFTPPRPSHRERPTNYDVPEVGQRRPRRSRTSSPAKFCAAYSCGKKACGDCKEESSQTPRRRGHERLTVPSARKKCSPSRESKSPKRNEDRYKKNKQLCECLIRMSNELRVTFDQN